MKHILYTGLLAAGLLTAVPAAAKVGDLLPKPQNVALTQGTPFALQRAVGIADETNCAYLKKVFTENGCTISADAEAKVTVEIVSAIDGAFNHVLPEYPDEAYQLEVTQNEVKIKALTPTGVIRAAQTLQQLAEGYDEGQAALETLTMTDWPAFKLRGFMHDVGRSFYSFEELKNQIDLLARFKVNTFHWHLTDYTGWRIEVKTYPQLTAAEHQGRYPGQFYTQAEASELVAYAKERGVIVIPEIDMPGHSHVFKTAMGFDMQTDAGVEALKNILDEMCEVFKACPYIHLGGDEVSISYPNFLETMSKYVRDKEMKVVMWNPLVGRTPNTDIADMTQMWSTGGRVVKGLPNIDCRYNYTNHFDVYADVVGIYKSSIYYADKGTADIAGTISAAWNDTKVPTEDDITKQNNIYANILASAERAWLGGGEEYIETGGTTLPNSGTEYEAFADFERRFLFHKAHSLKNEPIPYVKQTNVRWRITDPFPNGGNNALALPPETSTADILPGSFEYDGKLYGTHFATGAGIYLRHIWHPTVPSFFSSPANNQTAYAWTYVYSETAQDVGAQVEFYTYSRSGNDTMPLEGQWDRRGSKLWVNDEEVAAPKWEQANVTIHQNHATEELKNENFTARPVTPIHLNAGWNKVFMRLPHVDKGGTARDKWQFTFVLTDLEGKNAIDGLIYSPTKSKDVAADEVALLTSEISAYISANFSDELGYYPASLAAPLREQMEEVSATLSQPLTPEERAAQKKMLNEALAALKESVKTAQINLPKASNETDTYVYTMCTPLRGNRYPTASTDGGNLKGATAASVNSYWKFELRDDQSFNIINPETGLYISPASANNAALKTTAAEPSAGWTLKIADAPGYFIVTSGTVQFNQQNHGEYSVLNWGGGNNVSDAGCKYKFAEVALPVKPKLSGEKHNYWYNFCTPLREGRYVTSTGAAAGLMGTTAPTAASEWKFVDRADGTFDIVNRENGGYISPAVASNTQLVTVDAAPATGWQLKDAATAGYFIIVNGSAQFNQTNGGLGYKVYNWGNGTNTTDGGCQYAFFLVDEELVSGIHGATTDAAGNSYYDLCGRKVYAPGKGVFIKNGRKVVLK